MPKSQVSYETKLSKTYAFISLLSISILVIGSSIFLFRGVNSENKNNSLILSEKDEVEDDEVEKDEVEDDIDDSDSTESPEPTTASLGTPDPDDDEDDFEIGISDDEVESEEEIEVESGEAKIKLKVKKGNGKFEIEGNGPSLVSDFPVSVGEDGKLTITTPSGVKTVTFLPMQAVENMLTQGVFDVITTNISKLKIKTENEHLVYEFEGTKKSKVLGLFERVKNKNVKVSIEDGSIVNSNESIFDRLLDLISF